MEGAKQTDFQLFRSMRWGDVAYLVLPLDGKEALHVRMPPRVKEVLLALQQEYEHDMKSGVPEPLAGWRTDEALASSLYVESDTVKAYRTIINKLVRKVAFARGVKAPIVFDSQRLGGFRLAHPLMMVEVR